VKTTRLSSALRIGAAIIAIGAVAIVLLARRGASASDQEPAAEAPFDNDLRERRWFEQYPSDEGAIPYEDLAEGPIPESPPLAEDGSLPIETAQSVGRETRASVDDAQAWAEDNGYEVSQAWSRYSQLKRHEALVKRAANQSGLSGLEDVGVQQ
jgi:hypothetical protein